MHELSTIGRHSAGAAQTAGHGAALSLCLLNGFELRLDGRPQAVPLSGQRVVAFLGLNPGPLARIFVAGHLWTDASDERAAAALRTALWRLGRCGGRLVRCRGQSLSLDPAVEIDVAGTAQTARDLLDADATDGLSAGAIARLRDAGEVLPDWYEDWVLIERERHRQLRLHAIERLCVLLSAEGRHAAATEAGLAAVASEPLRESAHRVLIAAHLAEGNPGEALRQYAICCRLLRRDLNVGPSPALQDLMAPLLRRP